MCPSFISKAQNLMYFLWALTLKYLSHMQSLPISELNAVLLMTQQIRTEIMFWRFVLWYILSKKKKKKKNSFWKNQAYIVSTLFAKD